METPVIVALIGGGVAILTTIITVWAKSGESKQDKNAKPTDTNQGRVAPGPNAKTYLFFFPAWRLSPTESEPTTAFWQVAVVDDSKEAAESRARAAIKDEGWQVDRCDGDFLMDEQKAAKKPEFLALYKRAQQTGVAANMLVGQAS